MRRYLHLVPLLGCPLFLSPSVINMTRRLLYLINKNYPYEQCCRSRCLSRILIFIRPGSWISDSVSRIQSNNKNKRGGEKTKFYFTFFEPQISQHWKLIYFWTGTVQKKMLANLQRIILLFTSKIVSKLAEIWIGDPRSGFNLCRIRICHTANDEWRFFLFFTSVNVNVKVEEMNVCDNLGDHLVGNVFVKFKREEDAEKAVADLNNRW